VFVSHSFQARSILHLFISPFASIHVKSETKVIAPATKTLGVRGFRLLVKPAVADLILVRPHAMTPNEEQYVHFVECIQSLNRAWRILKELSATEPGVVRAAAYRMALVEYAKPYKGSYGTHRRGKHAYMLSPPNLTSEDIILHQRILDLRDQVLAHSDLTLKEAIVYCARVEGKPLVTVGANYPPSLPNVDSVLGLIERTLDEMYIECARLEDTLVTEA
jgi:hypothetical protein